MASEVDKIIDGLEDVVCNEALSGEGEKSVLRAIAALKILDGRFDHKKDAAQEEQGE